MTTSGCEAALDIDPDSGESSQALICLFVFQPCLSFAEKTAKCRIAGRRLLGHTVAHDGDGIYQDTCFARHQGAGERSGAAAVADGIGMAEARD